MSNTVETGHAKNTANLEHLITIAVNEGPAYMPSNPNLTVSNLQVVLANSRAALTTLKNDFNTWKNTTNDREMAFEPLKHLSTKLLNILISSGAPAQTVKDFKTINAKIQGTKINKTKAAEPVVTTADDPSTETLPAHKTISSSQQSYDSMVDHFEKAVILLNSLPFYAPSEPELTVSALQTSFTNFQTLNTASFNSSNLLSSSRINRDKVMYTNPDSLYELAKAVKAYIKGKFGAGSPEYKQVSIMRFSKIKSGK